MKCEFKIRRFQSGNYLGEGISKYRNKIDLILFYLNIYLSKQNFKLHSSGYYNIS